MAYTKKQKAIIIANIINRYPEPADLKAKLMTSQNAYVKIAALKINEDWDIYEYSNFLNNHFIRTKELGKVGCWILIAVGVGLLATGVLAGLGYPATIYGTTKLAQINKRKIKKASQKDIDFGNNVNYDTVYKPVNAYESYQLVSEAYDMAKVIRPELYIKSAIKKANRCLLILRSELKQYNNGKNPYQVIAYTKDIKKVEKFKNYCEQVLTVGANEVELKKFVRGPYFKGIEGFLSGIISSGHDTVIDESFNLI